MTDEEFERIDATVTVTPSGGSAVMAMGGVVVVDRWEFYKSDGWRWRRVAANGRIVGASTQGYRWKRSAKKNARRNGWPG